MTAPKPVLVTIPISTGIDEPFVLGYRDPLLLDMLSRALDGPVSDDEALDLACALEGFGGSLSDAQRTKLASVVARQRHG